MALHDRDYVREKNFDYKKMEYGNDVHYDEKRGDVHLGKSFSRREDMGDYPIKKNYPSQNFRYYSSNNQINDYLVIIISFSILLFWLKSILKVF